MGAGSTSNSQFPRFSSQAPKTPEQQAFLESRQPAFVAFQQDFQNRQQNPPKFEMAQQQSQSSNSLSQTESQPKKCQMKRTAKKGNSSEPIGDVTLHWTSDEETLLANVSLRFPRIALANEDALPSYNFEGCVCSEYPRPEFVEEETLEQTRKRCKWDNDDHICRGHILNGMSDALFDVYQNVESAKELWDQLEAKYMADDTSSKKFLVSNFNNYIMVDSRQTSTIMEGFQNMLKHNKDELSLVQLGSHFRIEETLRMEESGKGKGKDIAGSSFVNMVEDDKNKKNNKNSKGNKRKFHEKKNDSNKRSKMTCWKYGKPGHFKKDCRVKKNNGVSTSGPG
ncbi:zinc finger, CCHC-type containing protein [Tanacetum coccineum]